MVWSEQRFTELLMGVLEWKQEASALLLPPDNCKKAVKPDADDVDDIRRCLNGDGDAYARLVRRHQDSVAGRMWRFTRDRAEHRELVQEVFVEAYTSLRSFKGRAPFGHWLAKIATTVGYRYWKTRSIERSRNTVPIEEWADRLATMETDPLEPSQAAELLQAFLDKLPPRDRLVMMLRHVEDRSVEETAALTGWTESMVKVQSWRARRKLRKLFEQAGLEVA
jgi:RNA polymerase sigma-70 factor (ECF subfamily)